MVAKARCQGPPGVFMDWGLRMNVRITVSKRRDRGFSLVELVIVIVIIGIIAAIAIPRVGRASKGASESALSKNLSVLRNAIEMYGAEHEGVFPGANADGAGGAAGSEAALISQLTKYSDISGNVSNTWTATCKYGPYLRKGMPPLPVGTNRGETTVKVGAGGPTVAVASGEGWVYNHTSGDIIANADDDNEAGSTTYDKY